MQLRAQRTLTGRPGPSSDSLVPLCDRGHRAGGGLLAPGRLPVCPPETHHHPQH